MSEENIERLRRAYERTEDGKNFGAILELLAPDVELVVSGHDPNAGVWHGHEGVIAFFASWAEVWEEWEFHPEQSVVVNDSQVAIGWYQRGKGRASGIEVVNHPAHLWTFRDGLAVRWMICHSLEDALAAADQTSSP